MCTSLFHLFNFTCLLGNHDAELLRRIVLPNGEVLRTTEPAKPTVDCLFSDVMRDNHSALKIFSFNKGGGAVVGAFNVQGASWDRSQRRYLQHSLTPVTVYAEVQPRLVGSGFLEASGKDVNGKYAVWKVMQQSLSILGSRNAAETVELGPRSVEIFAISHILRVRPQVARLSSNNPKVLLEWSPIGLLDMFNPGGAVIETLSSRNYKEAKFVARGSGAFGVYTNAEPSAVSMNGKKIQFTFNAAMQLMTFELEGPIENKQITIQW